MNITRWAKDVKRAAAEEQREHDLMVAELAAQRRQEAAEFAADLVMNDLAIQPKKLVVVLDGNDDEVAALRARAKIDVVIDRKVSLTIECPMKATPNRIAVITAQRGREQAAATMHWDRQGLSDLRRLVADCVLQLG